MFDFHNVKYVRIHDRMMKFKDDRVRRVKPIPLSCENRETLFIWYYIIIQGNILNGPGVIGEVVYSRLYEAYSACI